MLDKLSWNFLINQNISKLEGMRAYGPLLLAHAEGLGGPSGPLACVGNLFFNNYQKKIQENPLTFVKIWP